MYMAFKHSHLTLVILSIALFYIRLFMVANGRPLNKFFKIYPHINDTLLLATAAGLSIILQQYPFVHGWITVKLFCVIGYFFFVFKALKASPKSRCQWVATGAATACLVVAMFTAFSKLIF